MLPSSNCCSYCGGTLRVTRLTCDRCGLGYEGDFRTPRLSRLDMEQQALMEMFLLASGSLKQTAEWLGVSYPTLRNRLDKVIARLEEERGRDERRKQQILDDVERGLITPQQGARMIDSL